MANVPVWEHAKFLTRGSVYGKNVESCTPLQVDQFDIQYFKYC